MTKAAEYPHGPKDPIGPTMRERMEEQLAGFTEIVQTANALMSFIDCPQISPKTRANGRGIRENALRRALATWKEMK